jgi:hypothetical protein
MRLAMTIGTREGLCVTGMAFCTGDRGMCRHLVLEHLVDIAMTTGADDRIRVGLIAHLSRLVYGMTRHAILITHSHCRTVRLVTHVASGDVSVFFSVTVGTGHFGVHAGVILHFLTLFPMTGGTLSVELTHGDHERFVRICVAV